MITLVEGVQIGVSLFLPNLRREGMEEIRKIELNLSGIVCFLFWACVYVVYPLSEVGGIRFQAEKLYHYSS